MQRARDHGTGPGDGLTEHQLGRLGHRYAGTARGVVGIGTAALAPLAGPPVGVPVCTAVAVLFAAWSVYYVRRMRADAPSPVWLPDLVVVGALCLAQPLLVDPDLVLVQLSWVSPIASLTVAVVQWHLRPVPAVLATLGLTACYVAGAAVTASATPLAVFGAAGGAFMLVEAALSRLLWELVRRGGRLADAVMAEGFVQEQAAATEAARRAEQRRHWATVHDTAASTLLMVGFGEVSGREPWFPAQLARDVAALDREREPAGGLGEALARTLARSPLQVRVRIDGPPTPVPLPDVVVRAVDGAVGEALENVRRHAGTGTARLRARQSDDGLRVEVADDGAGFDPDAVPPGRTGLALSIRWRMTEVGGSARVRSVPGQGTEVVLEWPPSPEGTADD
ncbi:MAG: ATP-binding protein [Pseudonocardia sediminis]